MEKFYRIAGHTLSLSADADSRLWSVIGNFSPFEYEYGGEEVLCAIELADALPEMQTQKVYHTDAEGFPRLEMDRCADGGWCIGMAPENSLPTVARLLTDSGMRRGKLALCSGPGNLRFALDNASMLMYAMASATRNTLEIHSSVTLCDGRGYAFLGVSGTGKSTHSRLWKEYIPGSELLNDDNPVIRIEDGKAMVYGSPWSGKTPCYRNLGVPLGAVVRLSQSPENRIRPLSALEAYAAIFSSSSAFREIDKLADGIHSTIEQLVSIVKMYHLDCLPDREAAELCHGTVSR